MISEKIYQELRSTVVQPAILDDLAKVHKKMSMPGSPYYNLNNFLTPLFERLPGANIETSSLLAREKLENIEIEENDQIISLHVKIWKTNVSVSGAIEIALRYSMSGDKAPDIERFTFQFLLTETGSHQC